MRKGQEYESHIGRRVRIVKVEKWFNSVMQEERTKIHYTHAMNNYTSTSWEDSEYFPQMYPTRVK